MGLTGSKQGKSSLSKTRTGYVGQNQSASYPSAATVNSVVPDRVRPQPVTPSAPPLPTFPTPASGKQEISTVQNGLGTSQSQQSQLDTSIPQKFLDSESLAKAFFSAIKAYKIGLTDADKAKVLKKIQVMLPMVTQLAGKDINQLYFNNTSSTGWGDSQKKVQHYKTILSLAMEAEVPVMVCQAILENPELNPNVPDEDSLGFWFYLYDDRRIQNYPIHQVVCTGNLDLLKALVRHKDIDLNVRDISGKSVVEIIIESSRPNAKEMMEVMMSVCQIRKPVQIGMNPVVGEIDFGQPAQAEHLAPPPSYFKYGKD